jgi:hypothetical protein
VTFAGIRDGTANTIMFAESREENWAAWISGLSMYVVGVDPKTDVQIQKPAPATGSNTPAMLGWIAPAQGKLALNLGSDVKRLGGPTNAAVLETNIYFKTGYPHQGTSAIAYRTFGPSSGHPGAVQHAFGDAHGKTINDDVDPNVYVRLITRAGNEVVELP